MVGQDAWIDAAGEVLQAEHSLLGLVGKRVERTCRHSGDASELTQPARQRDQLVLGTIVEVALDATALLVLSRNEALPRYA